MTATSSGDDPAVPSAPEPRSPLDYAAIVLVAASGLLLLAGIVYAVAVADARNIGGSERFRLLAQASSPFVAALALAGITMVVQARRHDREPTLVAGGAAVGLGSVVALVALLLALNGVVVDLTSASGMMFRLSNLTGRMGTVLLAGLALWTAATAPPPAR